MVDGYLRQSPLAHLHLDARAANDINVTDAGLMLGERRHVGMINLRGEPADPDFAPAVKKAVGVALPDGINRSSGKPLSIHILALGPDEWLIVCPPGTEDSIFGKMTKAMKPLHAAVTMSSEARTVIQLAGTDARNGLAKGCPLDLHPRAFGPGQCAQSILGRADILIHQTGSNAGSSDASYDLFVLRSFAEYVWTWLEDAGREYGVKVFSPAEK
ncbi:MAG: hypothetical protein HN877_02810 [Rhodospirillaceae bacterium]|nr:hypothetical protein [Rhodospirillaceae bacterium]